MERLEDSCELAHGLHHYISPDLFEFVKDDYNSDMPKLDADIALEELADAISSLHLSHWNDREIMTNAKSMLMNSDWYLGEDRENWEATIKFCAGLW